MKVTAVLVACLCALMMVVAISAQLFEVPEDKANPCPVHYPRTICASCDGCETCGVYPGTYAQCVGFCHPGWGWAPGTQVKITYFPYGEFSSGGCSCFGYTCFP